MANISFGDLTGFNIVVSVCQCWSVGILEHNKYSDIY